MSVLGLRVDSRDYEYYREELLRREKEYVLSVLKATFKQLIEELRRKKGAGETVEPPRGEKEVVLKIEQVQRVEESEVLRLYKRIRQLEKELSKALAELEEAKERLDRANRDKEACIQELEPLRRIPRESGVEELVKLKQSQTELLGLASVVLYCLEAEECDMTKLRSVLKTRLSKYPDVPKDRVGVLVDLVRRPK